MSRTKYVFTEACGEISGFGGGYEDACRTMVITGMEWLDDNPDKAAYMIKTMNDTGTLKLDNPTLKQMQQAMEDACPGGGSTGAMMGATSQHVIRAHEQGWQAYMDILEERGRKDAAEKAGEAN